jgi:type I restriction enzyme S subunit
MEMKSVPKGRKVDNFPDNWDSIYLKELIDEARHIRYGVVQPGKYQFNGCLMLRSQDYSKGWSDDSQMHRVNSLIENQYKKAKIKSGDLILTIVGAGIAQVVVAPKWLNGALLSRSTARIALNEGKANYKFILYYLSSKLGRDQILSGVKEGAQPVVSCLYVAKCLISLPPLPEQQAIAEVLSDTDNLIQALEKQIAKKRLIKQGVMQKLLSPKEGWVVKKLGDNAILKARIGWQGLTTAEYKESGDYYLITGTEFSNGYINWEKCYYVEKERYKQDKNIQIEEHDVLVTKDGTIGKVALIKKVPKPATLNSGVFVIRPINNSFNPEFFYFLLLSDVFSKFLGQLSAGSTINHLYQKDFKYFEFCIPKSIEEQVKIAIILSNMDSEIEILEIKLTKYKLLKQGLMQNLLTGKIRLVHGNI